MMNYLKPIISVALVLLAVAVYAQINYTVDNSQTLAASTPEDVCSYYLNVSPANYDSARVALGHHRSLVDANGDRRSATDAELKAEIRSIINAWWQKHQEANSVMSPTQWGD